MKNLMPYPVARKEQRFPIDVFSQYLRPEIKMVEKTLQSSSLRFHISEHVSSAPTHTWLACDSKRSLFHSVFGIMQQSVLYQQHQSQQPGVDGNRMLFAPAATNSISAPTVATFSPKSHKQRTTTCNAYNCMTFLFGNMRRSSKNNKLYV